MKKITIQTLLEKKRDGEKITMLTGYDYSFARLEAEAGVDSILVGDSLGMVFQGLGDTLAVTVDEIIYHTKAVRRGAPDVFLISDMPFMSYRAPDDALRNAGRMVKEGGCDAVKLEGGARVAEQIRAIRGAEIPVVGHLGLTPQSIKAFGGFKVQGKTEDAARRLIDDALAIEEAGAGAVVVECVPTEVARTMTEKLTIPTIGIGAGPHCDGQVLVYQDLLGLYDGVAPKFVKRYADAGAIIKSAFKDYVRETKEGEFPDKERSFL